MLNIYAELRQAKIKQSDVAKVLGLSEHSTSKKLRGEREFTAREMFVLQNKFFPNKDIKYLFSNIGDKQ